MQVTAAAVSADCACAEKRTASAIPNALVPSSAAAQSSVVAGRSDQKAETNVSATAGHNSAVART